MNVPGHETGKRKPLGAVSYEDKMYVPLSSDFLRGVDILIFNK